MSRINNFPNANLNPKTTPQEISHSLHGLNKILELPPCTKNNPDGVRARLEMFFEFCETEGRRPTVELMTVFLGVTRMALWKWQQDQNSEAGRLVTSAKNLINVLLTEWALDCKVPYAYVCFSQKNHFGYQDEFQLSAVTPQNHFESLPSKEDIIKRLPQNTDIDEDPNIDDIL